MRKEFLNGEFLEKEITLTVRVPAAFDDDMERQIDEALTDTLYDLGCELVDSKEYKSLGDTGWRIGQDLVEWGYKSGHIEIVDNPDESIGVVCKIWDNWFYFGGQDEEDMSKVEYVKSIPEDEIIKRLYEGLNNLGESFGDEYHVYYCYLKETFANDKATKAKPLADVITEIDSHKQKIRECVTSPETNKQNIKRI